MLVENPIVSEWVCHKESDEQDPAIFEKVESVVEVTFNYRTSDRIHRPVTRYFPEENFDRIYGYFLKHFPDENRMEGVKHCKGYFIVEKAVPYIVEDE